MLIHVDIETVSPVPLAKTGVYIYAQDPRTEILCLCYLAENDDEIHTWYPGDAVPRVFTSAEPWTLVAHNASFEVAHFVHLLGPRYGFTLPSDVICTMAFTAGNGYPLGLGPAAAALKLPIAKDQEGATLMRRMCKPCKGSRDEDEYRTDLRRLAEYCAQDVRVEVALHERLHISEFEQKVYAADQRINHRGVAIDLASVRAIARWVENDIQQLTAELRALTAGQVQSPNQAAAIRSWLAARGIMLADLRAATVATAILSLRESEPVAVRVLKIRQAASLASLKKYPAMLQSTCDDGRARGLFTFCGAFASGRWAGRRIQLQNLPRLSMTDEEVLSAIDEFVTSGPGRSAAVAKQLLRPMIYGEGGLVVGDWASIELRVSAWLSAQGELLEELINGDDVYSSMAAAVYRKTVKDVTKDERHLGKILVLGAGYGLGAKTFLAHLQHHGVAADADLAQRAIDAYRVKNYRIKGIWGALSRAAMTATKNPRIPYSVGQRLAMQFFTHSGGGGTLGMRLPSGRVLKYHDVQEAEGPYGPELTCASYDPQNGGRKKIYGGLFFENACQGVARDLLAETLLRAEDAGYRIVAHVHDEIVVEGTNDVQAIKDLMETLPAWAEGLPIKAEVFDCAGAGGRYVK